MDTQRTRRGILNLSLTPTCLGIGGPPTTSDSATQRHKPGISGTSRKYLIRSEVQESCYPVCVSRSSLVSLEGRQENRPVFEYSLPISRLA